MRQIFLIIFALIFSGTALANEPVQQSGTGEYFSGKKVMVAYFSWGGTTRRMAQEIQRVTGGDLFEIEPVNPYPTSYTPCTEVALEEKNNNARPEIKNRVENWNEYDVVFIGCPVWWWTTPMIIHTFAESYDFGGKTVVPFCTYAATYRDETLQAIVDMTPAANHLEGLGTTGSTSGVQAWIERINNQWNESAGIEDIAFDSFSGETMVYDLNGNKVNSDNLAHGIYIVKSGNKTTKILK